MMKIAVTILFTLTTPAVMAVAQTSEFVPVDQAVGDLDPLSTSLRRVNVGLRSDGEHTSLFQFDRYADQLWFGAHSISAIGSGTTSQLAYYRVAPGFQAVVDRVDYAVPVGQNSFRFNVPPVRDNQFIELTPANTVFVLTPPAPVTPTFDYRIDRRIDGRIDLRIDGRIHTR